MQAAGMEIQTRCNKLVAFCNAAALHCLALHCVHAKLVGEGTDACAMGDCIVSLRIGRDMPSL